MELVRRRIGSVLVIGFAEPISLVGETSARFKVKIRSDISDGTRHIVMDLGNVGFVDSSGLGALISALKVLRANDGDLKLAGLNDQVRSVLEITRLLRVFEAYTTAEEALGSFTEESVAPSH